MKKFYFILGIAFLTIVSCKNKETSETDVMNDTVVTQDSTEIVAETEVTDSTVVDSSDVDLLNKMSTSTTTSTTDPSDGRYALSETKWKLVELNGKAVKSATKEDYFINLDSKSGKFAAYAGCNNFSGTFVMKAAKKLAFSKIAGTKMACSNMSFESNFITTIEKTDNYMIEENVLHLHKGKATLAKFESIK